MKKRIMFFCVCVFLTLSYSCSSELEEINVIEEVPSAGGGDEEEEIFPPVRHKD